MLKRKYLDAFPIYYKINLHISLPEFVQCEICNRPIISYHEKFIYYCSKDCLEIYALTFLLTFNNLSFDLDYL